MGDPFGGLGAQGEDGGSGRFLRGLAAGIVTDNKDPEGLARVRVVLAGTDAPSSWVRTAMPMAGTDRGTYFLPEVGDEVVVGAFGGDPSQLCVLGTLWNGRQRPPADNRNGSNDKRLVKTRSGHQLLFDDGAEPAVELKLDGGKRLKLDREGVLIEDGSGNRITIAAQSGSITIESKASLKLKSPTISIEADSRMDIRSHGSLTIQGQLVEIN